MAWPSALARTKNWGTETLTDSDLEGQFDLIITYINDMMSSTTGHKHDATDSEGPKIATGGLDLSTITQNLVMTSKILKLAKGADVASAAGNIELGEDGNFFDITGTAAITSITIKQAGTVVILQFDSTATLTDGGNLLLDGNFTGAAGKTIALVSDGTNWVEIARQPTAFTVANALSGSVIQTVNTQVVTSTTGTTTMPFDDTIPQNTEGNEFMTLAITPNNSSNLLEIEVLIHLSSSADQNGICVALFQDSTAGALCASYIDGGAAGESNQIRLHHYMTAGTTSSTTFKVRAGGDAANTMTFNGTGGSRKYGGVLASSITIREIKA